MENQIVVPLAPPETTVTAPPPQPFLLAAFSDNGSPSSSRLLTGMLSIVVSVILLGVFYHLCHIPDLQVISTWLLALPVVIGALIGLMIAPYGVNRGSGTVTDIIAAVKK